MDICRKFGRVALRDRMLIFLPFKSFWDTPPIHMRFKPGAIRMILLVVLAGVLLTACEPRDSMPFTSEVDEPHFRRGSQLLKAGRTQEALAAFLKVIEKRGSDAPESHLEVGLLYLQNIKDPIAAIYHFRKFLELRPNSPQADLVRQRIDTATKEFARTLPAQPLEGQLQRLELMDLVEKLQAENFQLKDEISRLRGMPPSSRPLISEGAAGRPTSAVADEPDALPATPVTPFGQPRQVPTAPAVDQQTPAEQQPGAVRSHVVRQGDTLYRLSTQYYGTGRRWREIYEANRDVMRSETDLRIGMTLKIP
jgi:tetratricopeptide (TPR) repeat protein